MVHYWAQTLGLMHARTVIYAQTFQAPFLVRGKFTRYWTQNSSALMIFTLYVCLIKHSEYLLTDKMKYILISRLTLSLPPHIVRRDLSIAHREELCGAYGLFSTQPADCSSRLDIITNRGARVWSGNGGRECILASCVPSTHLYFCSA